MDEPLIVMHQIEAGSFVYSIMGYGDTPSFLHIDSTKTNNNSVLVPIEVVRNLLYISSLEDI